MMLTMTMVLASGTMVLATGEAGLTQVSDKVMDEPVEWARVEVEEAIGRQLIPEYLLNNYGQSITRKDFCILAVQLIEVKAGLSIEDYIAVRGLTMAASNTFVDTSNSDILAAKTLGITDGTSPNTFDPLKELTREQAAKFLSATARAVGEDITAETPPFADADDIANWAKPYTGFVFNFNVMKGVGDNRFDPKGAYQRQQAFMTMNRLFDSIDEVSMELMEDNDATNLDTSMLSTIKEDLITMAQPEKYLTILHGSAIDIEADASYSLAYEIYHHYGDVRMDTFMYDRKVNEITYFKEKNTTDLHYISYTDFAEYRKGNLLPLNLLSVAYLEDLEVRSDPETFIVRYETYDLEKSLYVKSVIDGVTEETWFSMTYRVPVKYHKQWLVGDELSEVKLELLLIDEEADFGSDYFVLPVDVELVEDSADVEEETTGEIRDMLMYEVDSIDAEEVSMLGTIQAFYYTKASFHELVLYFEGVLEGSEGYTRADLYDKMLYSGTLNGTPVDIIVYNYQDNEPGSDVNGVLISY